MNLQNGYKVIYDKATGNKRAFFASYTGTFADAEPIGADFEIGKYKLIYEKDGSIYGSETGIPAEGDHCFEEFDKVLTAETDEPVVVDETEKESIELPDSEPTIENPTVEDGGEF